MARSLVQPTSNKMLAGGKITEQTRRGMSSQPIGILAGWSWSLLRWRGFFARGKLESVGHGELRVKSDRVDRVVFLHITQL